LQELVRVWLDAAVPPPASTLANVALGTSVCLVWRQPAETMLVFNDGDVREQSAFEIGLATISA
jgi:hypothetical protein